MAETIQMQVQKLAGVLGDRARRAAVLAVNHGAQELAKLARGAARARSSTNAAGRDIVQAIQVTRATMQQGVACAVVWISPNDEKGRNAIYVHENYHGYTVRPKVKKMLFIPLNANGRRHTLYAEDAQQKKLKGWIGGIQRERNKKGQTKKTWTSGATGEPFGYWGEDNANAPLDFILVKEAHIPPNPRAGFLTKTARTESARIRMVMHKTYNDAMMRK
jgi:hypothetical protein